MEGNPKASPGPGGREKGVTGRPCGRKESGSRPAGSPRFPSGDRRPSLRSPRIPCPETKSFNRPAGPPPVLGHELFSDSEAFSQKNVPTQLSTKFSIKFQEVQDILTSQGPQVKNSPTSSTFVYLDINEGAVLFTDIHRSEYGYRSLSAYLCSHIVAMHFFFFQQPLQVGIPVSTWA